MATYQDFSCTNVTRYPEAVFVLPPAPSSLFTMCSNLTTTYSMTGGNMRPWQPLYSISEQPNWRLISWPHTTLAKQGQVAHKDGVVLRHWVTGSDFLQQVFFDYWAVCMHSESILRSVEELCSTENIELLQEVAVIDWQQTNMRVSHTASYCISEIILFRFHFYFIQWACRCYENRKHRAGYYVAEKNMGEENQ